MGIRSGAEWGGRGSGKGVLGTCGSEVEGDNLCKYWGRMWF